MLTFGAGSDGTGGKDKEPRTRIVGSRSVVFDPIAGTLSVLFSRIPGRQTVPRSELWAMCQLLLRMDAGKQYTIDIDAQFVLNGLSANTQHYREGANGDL